MKNADYWARRNKIMQSALQNKALDYAQNLETQYQAAIADIDKQIRAWYQRFANNNTISYADAQKVLTAGQLKEFKWTVEQYIKKAKANGINGPWTKQLENISARVHISRLEALKIQLQQQAEDLTGKRLAVTQTSAQNAYLGSYYGTAYELQKGLGVGWTLQAVNTGELQKMLSRPWTTDDRTFTARCWTDKNKLVQAVNRELTRMIATGAGPDNAIAAITKQFGVSARNAARVVMTESAYFATAAQRDCFNDLEVEEFQVVGTFDKKTCDICGDMNGKHFSMDNFRAGETAPPFHPWCRCCTAPYFADMAGVGERWRRNPDTGEGELIPADTPFEDWKKKFVKPSKPKTPKKPATKPLQNAPVSGTMNSGAPATTTATAPAAAQSAAPERVKLEMGDFFSEFSKGAEKKQTQAVIDAINDIEDADQRVVSLYKNMTKFEDLAADNVELKIGHSENSAVSTSWRRSPTGNGRNLVKVKVDVPKLVGDEHDIGRLNTVLHEEMHFIDCLNRDRTTGKWFSSEFKQLRDAFPKPWGKTSDIGPDVKKLFDDFNKACDDVRTTLSKELNDKLSALNDAMLKKTYKGTYADYKKEYKKLIKEYTARIDAEERSLMGGGVGNLQDIYDALAGGYARDRGVVKFGHGSKYYADFDVRMHETIANYASLSVTRPDLVKLLHQDKPDLAKALDEAVDELMKKGGIK